MERLKLPFSIHSLGIDESRLPDEPAEAMVERLARAKAMTVAADYPDALIIGADQTAVVNEQILNKPGNYTRAFQQLQAMSGRTVQFLTCLYLYDGDTEKSQSETVVVEVAFRDLTGGEIAHYLRTDTPYDCAGSFKSEAGGITLVERISSHDATALLGLPLLSLLRMFRNFNYNLP